MITEVVGRVLSGGNRRAEPPPQGRQYFLQRVA